MKKYQVHLLKADGTDERLEFDKEPTLEQMQAWVGGYIEHLDVYHEGKRQHMIVNEEGAITPGMKGNLRATMIMQYPIFGDAFIINKMS